MTLINLAVIASFFQFHDAEALMIFRLSIALLAAGLAGCVATGPVFTDAEKVPPGDAVVYIYRHPGFAAGARSAYFYVNDVNAFDLNQRGYSWVSLPPGRYVLRQKWPIDMLANSTQLDIDVKPGEVRYFSFETGLCPAGYRQVCISYVFREQDSEAGRAAISDMRFQDNFGQTKLRELGSR